MYNNLNCVYIVSNTKQPITITLPTISNNTFLNNQIINYTIINNSNNIVYIKSQETNPMFNTQILPKIIPSITNSPIIDNYNIILNNNRLCNLYINDNYNNNKKYVWLVIIS